uniref:Uncharacterized protein n=1 Tax=Arundo donax TaxID=35708 RepID=A0A0A9BGN0_ARUDO
MALRRLVFRQMRSFSRFFFTLYVQ